MGISDQVFLIALGGNLPSARGRPDDTLQSALTRLPDKGIDVVKVSRFYRTPCFPAGVGPDYVNAAAELRFAGSPDEFLACLHHVEAEFGRERRQRWGQRVLDLDLLAAGQAILPDRATFDAWQTLPLERQMQEAPKTLILPHPRLQDRAFVLVPLSDIAPHWRHPVTKRSVLEMLADLPELDVDAVSPLD